MVQPPLSLNVKINGGKTFLKLLKHYFTKGNQLQKIFNRNTVKMSYCLKNILGRVA